uniref:Uncharacterized protein n=1 Tax=Cliftonaea pectinata TaxID=2007206 RepID=A0A1Z1MQ37_9FLOR|nr:hypothetical protein [Cliftonaea pectinata]ARW68190.1 hypothetical protein [Cliftonaea pectinata]
MICNFFMLYFIVFELFIFYNLYSYNLFIKFILS